MATKKEIEEHLKVALEEVGEIQPWFEKDVNAWVFSHKKYPDVEYGGESAKEVVENYPKYLREFIKHRLNNNLSPRIEKNVKGRGGKRDGSGRPKGTTKELKVRIYLPKDVAEWFLRKSAIPQIRQLMAKGRH